LDALETGKMVFPVKVINKSTRTRKYLFTGRISGFPFIPVWFLVLATRSWKPEHATKPWSRFYATQTGILITIQHIYIESFPTYPAKVTDNE